MKVLIAGATGSGKSVCVNAIISSLLCTRTPDQVQFIMIDPKMVELTAYNGIPHLRAPVVIELERVVGVLNWAVREMDNRYKAFNRARARNVEAYNQLGMLYRRHGQLEDARFIYEQALKLDPDNTHLHWNLAILYDRYLPNPHKSLQHYQRYRQLTGSEDASLLAWIAELQAHLQGDNITARVQP